MLHGPRHRARRTSFVGRARDVAALRRWYESPDAWLATIVGPPGAGKTRLAHEIVGRLGLSASTLFVSLHGARASEVSVRLALAAGLSASDGASVARAVRERFDLLVLDECELALDGVATALVELSASVPSLRVLATSRRRLGLAAERIVALDSFGTPVEGVPLDEVDSGRLLFERVRALQPDYVARPRDDAPLRAILERVGDLPLAIELVAAQIAELGPASLATRLTRPLDWLVGERRDDHRGSLEHALAQSFDTLEPSERRDLVLLARLERPFDAADAETLLDARALASLRVLRDRSWLVLSRDEGEGLYAVLPPIRQFLFDRDPAPIASEVQARLDAATIEAAARGREVSPESLASALRREPTSARACTAIVASHARFAAAGRLGALTELALELAERRDASEPALLRAAARAAIESGRFEDAERALARLERSATMPEAERVVHTTLGRARIDFRTGRYDRLRTLDLAPELVPAEDVEVLATAASMRGEHERAASVYVRALASAPPKSRPALWAMLARYRAETGQGDAALEAVSAAERESESVDPRVSASLEATRALVAHDRGLFDEAIVRYDAAIARYAAMGNVLAAYLRLVRAIAALEDGRSEEAIASFLAALEDVPRTMVQLAPLVALARLVTRGEEPQDASSEVPEIVSSTRLVRAHAARRHGDAEAEVEAAVAANAPFARWSVVSRVLARVARHAPTRSAPPDAPSLLVGADAGWFAIVGGPQVSLATRPVLQRVLSSLVALAEREPGARASVEAIAAAAWPGEKILAKAKRSRVQVAISTLRSLGLREHLSHGPSGYRIELPVRRSGAGRGSAE